MNVLMINHYAGAPSLGMEYRPHYFLRHLTEAGWHCAVVAGAYSHVRRLNPAAGTRRMQRTTVDGLDWYWMSARTYSGNGASRALSMVEFVGGCFGHARTLATQQQPDVVVASSTYPLDIYAAARIAKIANAALVFELHDMWPLSPQILGPMSAHHPFIILMQQAEDYYCRHADMVISVLPNAIEHLATRGLSPDRYAVVPNGAEAIMPGDEENPPSDVMALIQQAHSDGRLVVMYAGSVGPSHGLAPVIMAIHEAPEIPIELIILGQGPALPDLKKLVDDLHMAHVSFHPQVSRPQMIALLAEADIAYAAVAPSPLYRYGISLNKLYDYMMAGTCVLFAGSADVFNDPVHEAGAGVSVPHSTPSGIAGGLRAIAALSPAERRSIGQRGREYCLEHWTYAVLAQQYEAALLQAYTHHRQST